MDTNLFQAEMITSYALGQRRGFVFGVVVGAALVVYVNRYSLVRRPRPVVVAQGQTNYRAQPI
jgi:hypothetical protein